jgi:hypothetical protein
LDDDNDNEDCKFNKVMMGLKDGLVGDEEPSFEEDVEELAGDVEASDTATVEDIILQAQLNCCPQELSRNDSIFG